MDVDAPPVDKDDSAESCGEMDDAFFDAIGQTFDVVDSWDDKDETENSNAVPKPLIKEEPKDSVRKEKESGKSSSSSSRRSNSNNRDPRKRPDNGRKSKSPERRRFIPHPRRSPPRRLNPTPRRRAPPNNGRSSFLEEMQSQFPELLHQNNQMQFNQNHYNQMMPMQQMNFMPQMNYMQQIPQMQPFAPQVPFLPMNPLMMGGPSVVPVPVPAPGAQNPIEATQDPRTKLPEPPKKPTGKEVNMQQVKSKAFQEGKIGLTDYLRQVSNLKSQKASIVDAKTKRAKVHENCKEAVKILEEINANKLRLPFMLRPSEKSLPSMKGDPKMGMRSPLMMSDNNVLFLSQSKLANSRDAIQANPLRNISGKLFTLCRNVGLDLTDVSQKVQRKIDVEREKEIRLVQGVDISSNIVDAAKKKIHRSSQCDAFQCRSCEERAMLDEEEGNFIVRLDARTVRELTREQEGALAEVCRTFNLGDDRFKPMVRASQWDSDEEERRRPPMHDNEDRITYANPENPNMNAENNFITFSPYRRSPSPPPRSHSRSPRRRRITERLGAKVPSPGRPRYRDDVERMLNPTPPTYHIPSPPRVEHIYAFNGQRRSRSRSPSPRRQREKRSREGRSRTPDRAQRRGRF